MHYSMLAAPVDTEIFEKLGAKNCFSFYGKELAADVTHSLSHIVKRLSKILGCNVLDVTNENNSELCSLFPKVTFRKIKRTVESQ